MHPTPVSVLNTPSHYQKLLLILITVVMWNSINVDTITLILLYPADKASGLDKIKNEFIKAAPISVHCIILNFINIMLCKTLAPKNWCLDLIIPIHKEGDKDNPDNYRGLCIMNTLLKLVCTMMSKRLQKYLTDTKVINAEQIGFKRKSRTSDHIFTIKASVNKYVCDQKKYKLYAWFIDFKKAFDSVPQELLYQQLNRRNINCKFLSL